MAEVGIGLGVFGLFLWFVHDYYVMIDKAPQSRMTGVLSVIAIVLMLSSVVLIGWGLLL